MIKCRVYKGISLSAVHGVPASTSFGNHVTIPNVKASFFESDAQEKELTF